MATDFFLPLVRASPPKKKTRPAYQGWSGEACGGMTGCFLSLGTHEQTTGAPSPAPLMIQLCAVRADLSGPES